jgi:hypothetical protein
MLWSQFKDLVTFQHAQCRDTAVRVRDIQLRGALDGTLKLPLKAGNTIIHGATKQGMSSLLSRFGITYAFFSKCSPRLQTEILKEFLVKYHSETLLLRTKDFRTDDGESTSILRFAGSNKYDVYNDVDAINALSPYIGDDIKLRGLRSCEYGDRTEFMVLLSPEPLKVVRDFGLAVRIVNSETGLSSLRVDGMVMELACTNGMMLPKATLTGFARTHLAAKSSQEYRLRQFMDSFLPKLGEMSEKVQQKLEALTHISAKDIFNRLTNNKSIPQHVVSDARRRLKNYGDSGLDAVSALTETARDADTADMREHLQSVAGEIVF